MSKVTFYSKNGDPVEIENTPENKRAMEKAGFKTKNPNESRKAPKVEKATG
jgi:hypothetical protein